MQRDHTPPVVSVGNSIAQYGPCHPVGLINDDEHFAMQKGSVFELGFSGAEIVWMGSQGPWRGCSRLSGPVAEGFAILLEGLPGGLPKNPHELFRIGESGPPGDLLDRQVGSGQQLADPIESDPLDLLVHRAADRPLEAVLQGAA